jgi:hypothetical protein
MLWINSVELLKKLNVVGPHALMAIVHAAAGMR